MLERWNDDRMDALEAKAGDLDRRMEKGFERVDTELSEIRKEMKVGFDRLHRLMLQFCAGLVVALIIALVGHP